MKFLMSALLLLASLTSEAGIIKNKKNQDSIELSLDQDRKIITIVQDTLGEKRVLNLSLDKWDFQKESVRYIFEDESPLARPFMSTKTLIESDYVTPEMVVVFFLPAVGLDLFMLPISLPVNLFSPYSYRKFKKDMKLIQEVLKSDKTVKLSNRKFKRVDNLINFFE